jgi:hypothetical protein
MKLIFLDIDGVLNSHEWDELAGSTDICPELMKRLNDIVAETKAGVVISSAWRYMILGGAMTLDGFDYLMRTHGSHFKIIGHTKDEEKCLHCGFVNKAGPYCKNCEKTTTRGNLIAAWRKENNHIEEYVVIDDMDLDLSSTHPFVQTQGDVGLSDENVNKAIEILSGKGMPSKIS